MMMTRFSIVQSVVSVTRLYSCLEVVYEDNPLFIDPKGSSSTHLDHYLDPRLSAQKPH